MNDIVFIILLVLAGVLAFALTIYVINLVRKGRGGSAPQKEKKPGDLPDDEHKGAEAVVRQLRRYAALHEYKVVAPVALTGVHGTTDLDAVLVGWFGVLGVKCLGYGGEVYGSPDEAEWVQTVNGTRRKFKNPIARAKQSGLVLRDALFAAGLKSVPVETVVVFTGKRVQLALPRSTGHYTEKSFSAYLKSSRFEEDKKIQVEPVAAAFVQS